MITAQRIVAAQLADADAASLWAHHLAAAAERYEINTGARIAAWLAQVAHESGHLRQTEENLSYSADRLIRVWPNRFRSLRATDPDDALVVDGMGIAQRFARKPEEIASFVYASRMGNGPMETRDGWKHRGLGLIQLTGKRNQTAYAAAAGISDEVAKDTSILARAPHAALSAGWFWRERGCNELADTGSFREITRLINGALIGIVERERLYASAQKAFIGASA